MKWLSKNVVKAKFRMSSGKALHIQQRIIHIHTGHNSKKGLLPVCPGQRPSASSKPGPPERGRRQGFPGQLGDRQGQGKTMSAPSHARALAALRPQPSGSAREIVPQPSPWRGERTGNKCVTPPGQSSPWGRSSPLPHPPYTPAGLNCWGPTGSPLATRSQPYSGQVGDAQKQEEEPAPQGAASQPGCTRGPRAEPHCQGQGPASPGQQGHEGRGKPGPEEIRASAGGLGLMWVSLYHFSFAFYVWNS